MTYKYKASPWGQVQDETQLAENIFSVSTAGHGGIKPTFDALKLIPKVFRTSDNWYEEDCDCRIVFYFCFDLIKEYIDKQSDYHKGKKWLSQGDWFNKQKMEDYLKRHYRFTWCLYKNIRDYDFYKQDLTGYGKQKYSEQEFYDAYDKASKPQDKLKSGDIIVFNKTRYSITTDTFLTYQDGITFREPNGTLIRLGNFKNNITQNDYKKISVFTALRKYIKLTFTYKQFLASYTHATMTREQWKSITIERFMRGIRA
jgi:hypothetical protein